MLTVVAFLTIALIIGYAIVIGLMMCSAFAIASMNPRLVADNHRLRTSYKLLQDLLWFPSATLGSYLTAWVSANAHPFLAAILLAGILIRVLWNNSDEGRQNGLVHVLLSSVSILGGVALGYLLRFYTFG